MGKAYLWPDKFPAMNLPYIILVLAVCLNIGLVFYGLKMWGKSARLKDTLTQKTK